MKNLLLFSLLFCNGYLFAQKKWYSITPNDITIAGCQVISGAADGLHEMIVNLRLAKGNRFWDQRIAWKNKYRDFDNGDLRPAFPGAKTWLVFLTDGYHLTRTIDRSFTLLTIGISAGELCKYQKKDRWKVMLKKAVISLIANRVTFNMIYKNYSK